MIIQSRYRNVSWNEVKQCVTGECADSRYELIWENQMRGKPVSFEAPAIPLRGPYFICRGPFFALPGTRLGTLTSGVVGQKTICVHMVEIGD